MKLPHDYKIDDAGFVVLEHYNKLEIKHNLLIIKLARIIDFMKILFAVFLAYVLVSAVIYGKIFWELHKMDYKGGPL